MQVEQAKRIVKILMEEISGGSQEFMDVRDECEEILVRAGMSEIEAEEFVGSL
jgi:hypothetical protein